MNFEKMFLGREFLGILNGDLGHAPLTMNKAS